MDPNSITKWYPGTQARSYMQLYDTLVWLKALWKSLIATSVEEGESSPLNNQKQKKYISSS